MQFLFICLMCAFQVEDSIVTKNSSISAVPFSIVITEVMADPDPPSGLPAQEYCEIYNRDSVPVNLSGWTFYDGTSRALPAVIINPGEYVIICDDGDTSLFSAFGKFAAISSISLTNTGEKLAIRDPFGIPIDSVIYSDTWYGSSFKKDGGWSLEKLDVDFTCPASNNWLPSEHPLGGTPGALNSVAGTILDEEPPVLLRSFCVDSVSVILVFNESLDPDVALSLSNYFITPANIPVEAFFEDAFLQRIRLTLNSPITPGIINTVTVSQLTDCSGNTIAPGSNSRFGIGDSIFNTGLVINEILFNPFTDGFDFVELYHSGNGIIDISKFKIESIDPETGVPDESEKIVEEPWLLFPGDYLVLTENPSVVSMQYQSSYPFNFMEVPNLPSMNIDEGHIAISVDVKIVDQIHYFETFHFELLEDYKGISLEKINPKFQSGYTSSWHSAAASAGFATPGLKNSQYADVNPGGNQVSLFPEIFSPDNDGVDDVVTITLKTGTPGYISNTWIYNSNGQIILDQAKNTLLSTSDAFIWDGITDSGTRAPAGIYIAVVEVFNLQGSVQKYRMPFVVAIKL